MRSPADGGEEGQQSQHRGSREKFWAGAGSAAAPEGERQERPREQAQQEGAAETRCLGRVSSGRHSEEGNPRGRAAACSGHPRGLLESIAGFNSVLQGPAGVVERRNSEPQALVRGKSECGTNKKTTQARSHLGSEQHLYTGSVLRGRLLQVQKEPACISLKKKKKSLPSTLVCSTEVENI